MGKNGEMKKDVHVSAQRNTHLLVMLVQHLCDGALQRPELLVDVEQEVLQVHPVQLTALDQHLPEETGTVRQVSHASCCSRPSDTGTEGTPRPGPRTDT